MSLALSLPGLPTLRTRRLTLRPYVAGDWERAHLYASLPEVSQFEVWGPNSVADTQQFIATCIADGTRVPVTRYQLALELLENGLMIGGCAIKKPAAESTEASLGYVVNPDYQRQGYATEAALALIEFGFGQLQVSCISAYCDTRNVASRRVMEKAGLKRAALIRGERVLKGVVTDTYRYEILRAANSSA